MGLFSRVNNILTESNKAASGGKPVRQFQKVLGATTAGNSSLEEGQLIKGEVVDIRNGKVTIKLADDRTVTANLEGSSELSIGQYGVFRVLSNTADGLIFSAVAGSKALNMDATVKKALDAAGLPRTDMNMEIVRALLNNQMSIDKQSILKQLQQSYQFKGIDIHNLVFMNKHQIPLSPENAVQFENFLHNEHRIVQEAANLAESIPNILEQVKQDGIPALLKANQQILTILGNEPMITQITSQGNSVFSSQVSQNGSVLSQQIPQSSVNPSLQAFPGTSLPLAQVIPSAQERLELAQILEIYDLPEPVKNDLINGTIPLLKVVDMIEQSYQTAVDFGFENDVPPEVFAERNGVSLELSGEAMTSSKFSTDQFLSPVVRHIMDSFTALQRENNELGSFLPKEARKELSELLKELPLPKGIQEQLQNGSMKSSAFLNLVKNTLSYVSQPTAETLLTHKHYHAVLKQNILSHWTITPEQLAKQPDLGEFYEGMHRQLSALESLSMQLSGEAMENTGKQASDMKENIDFMKTLNQMFSYVQLPLKLKEQNIHGDLYIYTNKHELQKNKKDISILLHLDMTYMGAMDIHVVLAGQNVVTKFYLETDEARDLVSHNIQQLEDSLNSKGFLLQSETYTRKQELDPVSEFIEKEAPIASMKRYTFDIRT